MECEHENSARCISPPPLDDTVLYWSSLKEYRNKKCDKCLKTLKHAEFFRKCLGCDFVMCQDCWYDLYDQQGCTKDQGIVID